jgi:hypothetical protein
MGAFSVFTGAVYLLAPPPPSHRPVEFAELTYVSQQDRAVWSQPSARAHVNFMAFVLCSQKYVSCPYPSSAVYFNFEMTSHFKLQVEVEDRLESDFWVFWTANKEAKHDKSSCGRLYLTRFCRVLKVYTPPNSGRPLKYTVPHGAPRR